MLFIQILHIIQYFGFFSAQLTNSFLIYLIIKKARALFGAYRYVMGTFALFSLIYAWIEIATQPVMHIYGPIFVVYMDSPMKYEKWIGNDVTCYSMSKMDFSLYETGPPSPLDQFKYEMDITRPGSFGFCAVLIVATILLCKIVYKILRSCRFKRFPRFPMSYKIGQISQVQHSEFSFFHGPEEIQYCVQKDLDFCEHFLRENFPEHSVKFSENIVCVMVPRDGFKCGRHLQEFLPNEGKLIGSYLTYQFPTERAIITHYNLPDGRRFVAGIGIYPRLLTYETGCFNSFPIDEDICQEAMESGYDYVPPKPRKWTKRRAERFEMVTKAARDAGLIRPNEYLGNVRFVDNPPVYTKLIIEEEKAKLRE
ncbi:hypothetical protein B9Z55_003460 [Caenorhabditis nigoni]|uniref:Uncharacterized protein n=2 Tax=Caenorhabditis nigoni TaxID=1611254 RepID=A0A2G5VQX9_9PELO|nr:hypothetical protein B9Z55_003460 [Caenorhabditis nigoni]